ncbi:hypothetical protein GGF41_001621 [Coemansia sp. RSA 2531]|nr:hypothetical protein GGF41_001621 [Coemansia sp. RSA 2531]
MRRLWQKPRLAGKWQLTRLSQSVGSTPLFALGSCHHYGQLVQVLIIPRIAYYDESCGDDDDDKADYDVDMLDYRRVTPILKYCTRLKVLDMHTCMGMRGNQFERLFVSNPLTCLSLASLDISQSRIQVSSILAVLVKLSNLVKLVLSGADVNDGTLVAISKTLLNLEWLEIDGCLVSDAGIQGLVDGCQKLVYLRATRWDETGDCGWVQQINARGGLVSLVQVEEDDEFYDLPDEYDLYNIDPDADYDSTEDMFGYNPYKHDVTRWLESF